MDENSGLPSGFKLDAPAVAENFADPKSVPSVPSGFQLDEDKYGSSGQQAVTALEGVAQGAAGPLATMAEVGLGVPKEDILGRQKENPWAHGLGEVGGFTGSLLTGAGMASAAAHVGEGALHAGEAVNLISKASQAGETLSTTAKIGRGALRVAAETAMLAGGNEVSKAILQDPEQSAGSAIANMGLSAILGYGIGGSFSAIGAGATKVTEGILNLVKGDSEHAAGLMAGAGGEQPISPLLKKALSVYGGVAPEKIDQYLAQREAVNAAPGFEDLYNHALDHVKKVSDNLESHKDAFKSMVDEVRSGFQGSKYEAGIAEQKASQVLKEATQQMAIEAQQNAISKAQPIANAAQMLRSEAVSGSQAALDLLEQSGENVSLKPFIKEGSELHDRIMQVGTESNLNMANKLSQYITDVVGQYGAEVPAPIAKKIIQDLDKLGRYDFNATSFDKSISPHFNTLRRTLDQTLKKAVPGYEKAMKPVAEKFELLSNLSKFGTAEDAVGGILGLKNTKNFVNDMPLLRELEQQVGIKFTHDLDPYASKAIRQLRISRLPEYASAEKAAQALEYYRHPDTYETLMESLHGSEEAKSLEAAQAEKQEIGSTTEATLQSKLNAVKNGKNIANRELLSKFPGFEGMSIPEILDLINIREAFEKGATNGSRNAHIFGAVLGGAGGTIGGLLGGVSGAAVAGSSGAALGNIIGGVVDKEGPAMVKSFLDKYISHYGDLGAAAGIGEKEAKRALLHTFGAEDDPSASGFKAAAKYMENVAKGMKLTKDAAEGVFKGGASAIPQHVLPQKEDIEKLNKRLEEMNKDESKMLDISGNLGHYMPNHASHLASTTMKAVNLASIARPVNQKQSPLDSDIPISAAQKSEWFKTLEIMQQPLVALQRVKDGTLLKKDVDLLKGLYPGNYAQMSKDLNNAMIDHLSKGEDVPYKLRQTLSMFLGEPLDSTLTQPAIMAAQMSFFNNKQQNEMDGQSQGRGKPKTGKLANMAKSAETSLEARETRRNKA